MKVRLEYRRAESNKTFLWDFCCSACDLKAGEAGKLIFSTHHKTLPGAVGNFGAFLRKTYRKKIVSFRVLRRISKTDKIGVGEFKCASLLGDGAQ